jgi:AcrR family transcriptional regulator
VNKPLRSDAAKNAMHILHVAHDEFSVDPDVSMNAIAKSAGVGAGTLYRHFPTRESLVLAVYENDVHRLCESAADFLARHEPLMAFRLWFEQLADYVRLKHGLGAALESPAAEEVVNATRIAVIRAIAAILAACEKVGTIRPGIAPGDVLQLMCFMWRVNPGPDGQQQARRLTEIVLAGFGAGEPTKPSRRRRAN